MTAPQDKRGDIGENRVVYTLHENETEAVDGATYETRISETTLVFQVLGDATGFALKPEAAVDPADLENGDGEYVEAYDASDSTSKSTSVTANGIYSVDVAGRGAFRLPVTNAPDGGSITVKILSADV